MSENPLVSVVIATYNMAQHLPSAVQSILAQTYENIELLIIDDGSSDNTQNVLEPFLKDSRAIYRRQENKGQAAAKNHGVFEAKGKYIAFLDADDMWVSEKLELQIPVFSKSKAIGIVYAKVMCINESGEHIGIASNNMLRGRLSSQLFVRNNIGFGTSVVKKECFERLGGFNESIRMGIDYDLWLRFSTQYEFDYVDSPLLYYRIWPGQMSNNCKGRYLNGIQIMKNFLHNFPGVIDKKTEKAAWAYTYVGFGQCVRSLDGKFIPCLKLYLHALTYKPTCLLAWKAIAKAILGR